MWQVFTRPTSASDFFFEKCKFVKTIRKIKNDLKETCKQRKICLEFGSVIIHESPENCKVSGSFH
jgi:hypothetical protein